MATTKKWSQKVTDSSDAMDVRDGTFKQRSARKVATDVEGDAKKSTRKRSSDYQAAISMLTFYINRAGKNLSAAQRKVLENAKEIIRADYGKDDAAPRKRVAKKTTAKKATTRKTTARNATAKKKTAKKASARKRKSA